MNIISNKEIAIAVVVGIFHIFFFVVFIAPQPFSISTVEDLLLLCYLFVGLFVLGALPAVFLARQVYAPMAVFLVLLGGVIYEEWFVHQGPVVHLPPSWVLLYTLGWIVLLPVLAGIGGIEVLIRRRFTGSEDGERRT